MQKWIFVVAGCLIAGMLARGNRQTKSSAPREIPVQIDLTNRSDRKITPNKFRRIIEGQTFHTTLRCEGSDWNDTLIRNCRFQSIQGDGVLLRDVNNIAIVDCQFFDITEHAAIRGSISGGTSDILILRCDIAECSENGIVFGQRAAQQIDHTNLVIEGNRIFNTGTRRDDGKSHAIYLQATDSQILRNQIDGSRDGNAISIRSSGQVIGNHISGVSNSKKPGIRYYSDHQRGKTNRLLIKNNCIKNQRIAIDLVSPVARYDHATGMDHVVQEFDLAGNQFENNLTTIQIADDFHRPPYHTTIASECLP